jgi:hypothetical protein
MKPSLVRATASVKRRPDPWERDFEASSAQPERVAEAEERRPRLGEGVATRFS